LCVLQVDTNDEPDRTDPVVHVPAWHRLCVLGADVGRSAYLTTRCFRILFATLLYLYLPLTFDIEVAVEWQKRRLYIVLKIVFMSVSIMKNKGVYCVEIEHLQIFIQCACAAAECSQGRVFSQNGSQPRAGVKLVHHR
jgi:hypothetical protein